VLRDQAGDDPPTTVTIEDRYQTPALPITLRYPHRLCAPADKNQEGIIDAVQHLVGYEELRTPFTKKSAVGVSNQFGQLSIDLTRRDVLMVPSAKELLSTPPPLLPPLIDHFQCYRAKRAKGSAKFAKITVNVTDQIETNVPITHPAVPPVRPGQQERRGSDCAVASEQSALLPVEVVRAVRHGAGVHQQPVRHRRPSAHPPARALRADGPAESVI
jgi:hypothetical protein